MNIKNIAYLFITITTIVVVLIFGQPLIIPFIIALLLWFTVRVIRSYIERVNFINNKFPFWLKNLVTSLFMIVVLGFASKILTNSINELARSYKKYQVNVDFLINKTNEAFNIDLIDIMKVHAGEFEFGTILSSIFNSLTDIFGSAFMIVIYALFIFIEEAYFRTKLKNVFTRNDQYTKISTVLERIEKSVAKYLGLKTFVSLITGVLSYFALLFIGIDSPVFWAFLIFLLNFIPTIGSLIATLFPAVFCLLQFGEFGPGIMVLLIVGAIQVVVGNILEPKLMGNSLNLSALVTIVALSFWGAIWGVTGMILSIPITVILVIVFSQFPSTRPFAIMLSEKGEIEELHQTGK